MKPLLAHTIIDTKAIQYPVMVSIKLDGIRCLILDGVAVSRTLKPIRNKHIQSILGNSRYNGLDGEIIVGNIYDPACYRNTSSGTMSEEGTPDFTYHVFDRTDMEEGFEHRYFSLQSGGSVLTVPHIRVYDEAGLLEIESSFLEQGAEGVMVRGISGRYKQGRSTLKEGVLGKLKRFTDSEYLVMGYEERMHNANEKTTNALGYSERSTHQENKFGRGDLGALICRTEEGIQFKVGSGFDDAERHSLWQRRDLDLIGRIAKVKHFTVGAKDAPRFPTFLGFRDATDL